MKGLKAAKGTRPRKRRSRGAMTGRCCGRCVYAARPSGRWHRVMMGRFPGLRLCFNHVETPGRMREVQVDDVCRNYRLRHWPQRRRDRVPKPPNDTIRYVPLTHGWYAIVDAADHETLAQYRWHTRFHRRTDVVYAARANHSYKDGRREQHFVSMHRQIMQPPEEMVVDHINGNGLDNRRCNLRICTKAQNVLNRRSCPHSKSQFIGVFPRRGKWRAAVRYQGKQFCVGTFDDEVEAARARDRKAAELFGEFARLNFPETPQP